MNRRNFAKSLLVAIAGFLGFRNSFGQSSEFYKGKRLLVVVPDDLEAMCEKKWEGRLMPARFRSDKSIRDEMRRFVDMSGSHMDEFGDEVYGCVYEKGDPTDPGPYYSVVAFKKRRL